eukprot:CAMPEP_0172891712 /NCGR_PEP_ID=MMETSP1075-20121228/144481_1 /TAXON_ID=2916 /ORGANISM="Ceratium fusus, Strain PA161109" /LENGTH=171 /DNA_ID=CAMNT_0013746217 /DNA_START=207 /DNA_END=721 /DNA_ORIENTATION=-
MARFEAPRNMSGGSGLLQQLLHACEVFHVAMDRKEALTRIQSVQSAPQAPHVRFGAPREAQHYFWGADMTGPRSQPACGRRHGNSSAKVDNDNLTSPSQQRRPRVHTPRVTCPIKSAIPQHQVGTFQVSMGKTGIMQDAEATQNLSRHHPHICKQQAAAARVAKQFAQAQC